MIQHAMAPTTRSPDDPTTLRAGAARVEITPPAGGPMAGYFHERRSTGVLDPLYARALVLDDGTWRIGIVAVDAIALPAA
jgi:neutral ceramidase